MSGFLKLSNATNVTVLMIGNVDHISGQVGLANSLTIYATKAAATPTIITPMITELDAANVPGVYGVSLTSAHTNTLGELLLHVTGPGADPTDIVWQVSTYLPGEAAILQADQAVNATKIGGVIQTGTDIGTLATTAQVGSTISSAVSATIAEIDLVKAKTDQLTFTGTAVNARTPSSGAGAIAWPYTVTNSATGLPIPDADIWVTSDRAGLNVLASGRTDQTGSITFYLDAGTVYVFLQKSGFNFVNPDVETVL